MNKIYIQHIKKTSTQNLACSQRQIHTVKEQHCSNDDGKAHRLSFAVNTARFLELAAEQIPTLRGAKISSRELPALTDCLHVAGGRFQVMIGTDEVIVNNN